MASEPSWHRRLEVRLRRGREEAAVLLRDESKSGCGLVTPQTVHLRAGEKAIPVPISYDVQGASHTNGYLLIATTRPGVVARLAQQNTDPNCRSSGILMPTTDDVTSVTQDGATFPSFASGTWQFNTTSSAAIYEHVRAVSTESVQHDDDVMDAPTSTTNTFADNTAVARYIWGQEDYVNLGNDDDGKYFAFWVKASNIAQLTSATLGFLTRPYRSDIVDDYALTLLPDGGTPDEAAQGLAANSAVGGAYTYNFTSKLYLSRWTLITCRKRDFVAANSPKWSRITAGQVNFVYGDNAERSALFTSVYFGDPPDAVINSVALMPYHMIENETLVLSLDAPASTDATVEILGAFP